MICKLIITRTLDLPVEVHEFDGKDQVRVDGPFFEASVYVPLNGGVVRAIHINGDVNVTTAQVIAWRKEKAENDEKWDRVERLVAGASD